MPWPMGQVHPWLPPGQPVAQVPATRPFRPGLHAAGYYSNMAAMQGDDTRGFVVSLRQ